MPGAYQAATAFTPRRLTAALGGDTTVKAFFDDWFNVTVSSGNCTGWADYRSGLAAAPNPEAPFATGTKPTVAAGLGSPIVFSAGGATMSQSGSNNLFPSGTLGTFILIAGSTYAGNATGSSAGVGGLSCNNTDLEIGINTTPHWEGVVGEADTAIDSGIASGATIRVVTASVNGTTGSGSVANHAAGTATITSTANTGGGVNLGNANTVGATAANQLTAHAAIAMNGAVASTTQISYAGLYGQRRHGAVLAS